MYNGKIIMIAMNSAKPLNGNEIRKQKSICFQCVIDFFRRCARMTGTGEGVCCFVVNTCINMVGSFLYIIDHVCSSDPASELMSMH